METDLVTNPAVSAFFDAYTPQRNIIREFYEKLPEEQYDFRLAKNETRKSDSPRESLAHILEYRLLVFNGIRTGRFAFESMGVENYYLASKSYLLIEWDKIEQEMKRVILDPNFDSQKAVDMPWGSSLSSIEVLYLIRDHEILHVGWNLALMDIFGMERFQSLIDAWG